MLLSCHILSGVYVLWIDLMASGLADLLFRRIESYAEQDFSMSTVTQGVSE